VVARRKTSSWLCGQGDRCLGRVTGPVVAD
jgi:hypothetical protein